MIDDRFPHAGIEASVPAKWVARKAHAHLSSKAIFLSTVIVRGEW